MRRTAVAKSLVLAAACGFLIASEASAELSCKGPLSPARAALAGDVAAMLKIEHEASDRLKGLDTRPFPVLRDEARKLAARIGPAFMLELEKTLERCRNRTFPIHTICASAANALADVLEKHVASAKPEYDKAAYAAAVGECEWLMKVKPLKSALRGNE
jgi:hypothetical protein